MVKRSQSLVLFLFAAAVAAAFAASPSDNNGGFDHRAHAVPGGPYHIPDDDSDGFAMVTLNGELSHSHYFNPKTGATGKVIKYFWSVNKKVVCATMRCNVKFTRGLTRVELRVVDNTGDSATASTTVNVFEGAKPKLRYWFYPGQGWLADNVYAGQPKYSMTEHVLNMHKPGMFPGFLKRRKYSMRVLGNINMYKQGNYRFRLKCLGGACTMWVGRTRVLVGKDGEVISKPMMFSKGNKNLHIVYRRPNPRARGPILILSWQVPGRSGWSVIPRNYFSHNPAALKPVVRSVHPGKAKVGSVITIVGSSLVNIDSVQIGKHQCAGPTSSNQFVVKCVVPGITGTYEVYVRTPRGVSNSVPLTISAGSFGNKFGADGGGVGPVGVQCSSAHCSYAWPRQPILFRKSWGLCACG
ncbi:IPT/TIG [Gracilaria domingensis]|nr:IPT/TIG [Gracilaria domingensis]